MFDLLGNLGLFGGNLDPFKMGCSLDGSAGGASGGSGGEGGGEGDAGGSAGGDGGSGDGGAGAGAGDGGSGAGAGEGGQQGGDGGSQGGEGGEGGQAGGGEPKFYDTFESDLKSHPAITKFDNPEAMAKSYLNLEKLMGNDKIVKPKGPEDKVAWDHFNQQMGVPGDAGGYQLADTKTVDGREFDKAAFAAIAHEEKLRPDQAQRLWDKYTGYVNNGIKQATEAHQAKLNEIDTQLRHEWGEAYDSKMASASKFWRTQCGDDVESFNRLNAMLSQHPDFLKRSAKIAEDYSENSIGGFKVESHKMTPDEAQREYDAIMANQDDSYWGNNNEASLVKKERQDYVVSLIKMGANPSKIG